MMNNSIKHLDLFSGIGGFALAADWAFGKVQHMFCEIDPFCQEVLKKHWPNSKIYGDIKTLTRTENKQIDLLTGGFPCQPFSQAGRRRGTADDRYLWPEMLRVIREFHPRWIIGENVGGLATWDEGVVLEQVHTDLESEGYDVQAFIIPACAVNAPHRRDRIWIVGHAKYYGRDGAQDRQSGAAGSHNNSQGTQQIQQPARSDRQGYNATDNDRWRHEGLSERPSKRKRGRHQRHTSWDKNWLKVATCLCRMDDGISKRMDRNLRLKALGNAIVPQVAYQIMINLPL